MNKQLIFRGVLIVSVALLLASCMGKNGPSSQYQIYVTLPGEPQNYSEWYEIQNAYFDGGKDSVCVREYLTVGPVSLCSQIKDEDSLVGGFALCYGIDTLDTPDRKPCRFAVFDKGGNEKSILYTVFHDTLSTLMPKHAAIIGIPTAESSCSPVSVYVQNVQAVVQAVKHGNGLAGGPFGADDYLTLTVTGSLNRTPVGEKSVKLVDGTKVLGEWTEVDLSKIGNVDAVDFHLSSSRPDLPLYCCLDDLVFFYSAIYN